MSENEKGAYRQVLKYTGIFGGVQGLNVVVSLVRNKLAAVLLGPAGMGLVSLHSRLYIPGHRLRHFHECRTTYLRTDRIRR